MRLYGTLNENRVKGAGERVCLQLIVPAKRATQVTQFLGRVAVHIQGAWVQSFEPKNPPEETRPGCGLAGWPWGKGDCGFTIGKRGVGSPPSRARSLVEFKWGPSRAHPQHSAQGQPRRLHSRVVRALGGHPSSRTQPRPARPHPPFHPPSLPPPVGSRRREEGRRPACVAGSPAGLGLPSREAGSAPRRRLRSQAPSSFPAGLFARRPTLRAAPTPPRPRAASAAPAGAGASVPGRALHLPRSPIPPPPPPPCPRPNKGAPRAATAPPAPRTRAPTRRAVRMTWRRSRRRRRSSRSLRRRIRRSSTRRIRRTGAATAPDPRPPPPPPPPRPRRPARAGLAGCSTFSSTSRWWRRPPSLVGVSIMSWRRSSRSGAATRTSPVRGTSWARACRASSRRWVPQLWSGRDPTPVLLEGALVLSCLGPVASRGTPDP